MAREARRKPLARNGPHVYTRAMAHEAGGPSGPGPNNSGHDFEGDQAVATETEKKLKKPQLYKVLLHNDDYTTMEFVVMILMGVFNHDEPTATRLMLEVHQKGIGVAGVFSYEIAEAKVAKTIRLAREHEFPLRASLEPE